jgi:beta-glucosidase
MLLASRAPEAPWSIPRSWITSTALKDKYRFQYVGFARGFNRYGKIDDKLANEAIALAPKADIIVYFMGLDEVTESEGMDRQTLNLPYNQITLLKAFKDLGKRVVVILSAGSVVDLSWDCDCDALLHGALSGQAGCNSILDMLNGDVNAERQTQRDLSCQVSGCAFRREFPWPYADRGIPRIHLHRLSLL